MSDLHSIAQALFVQTLGRTGLALPDEDLRSLARDAYRAAEALVEQGAIAAAKTGAELGDEP